jgi:succinate-semialdehyde dehydrogenase/glutarate-semialdehyde dehydrogenase
MSATAMSRLNELKEEKKDERRYIENTCPMNGEVIGHIPICTETEVKEAVAKARIAQKAWGEMSVAERTRYVLRVRDIFVERKEFILDTIRKDTGKTRADALLADVFTVIDGTTYFCKQAQKMLAPHKNPLHLFKNKKSTISYEPLGVVGVITPWNFPTAFLSDVVLALLAGNSVLLKPSEVTPLIGEMTGKIFADAGFPQGVFQVLQGDGSTGAALVRSDIDKIVFTGSVRTGRAIYKELAQKDKFTPVALELGGKDPFVILEDADLERASDATVWGGLVNSGQMCASVERVYVMESIAEEFTKMVVEKVKKLRQGPQDGPDVDIGAIIFPRQMDVIDDHVKDALEKGARLLAGGGRNEDLAPGYYYQPTVLSNVNHSMKVMTEETFGPIIPIMVVKSEEEAIKLANDSVYGLTAGVWSQNPERAERVAKRIEAGTVAINDCGANAFGFCEAPWFGVKESGFGAVHSKEGVRNFSKVKHIVTDRGWMRKEIHWFPNNAKNYSMLSRLVDILFSKGEKRLKALFGED